MRRHSFVARLGPADTGNANLAQPGTIVTEIRFVDGCRKLGFGLGSIIDQLLKRAVYLSDVGVDLALLAALVTAADTRLSRKTESQDSWTREIDLYLPVNDPPLWKTVTDLIQRMLTFLTGDRWCLYVRPRNQENLRLYTLPDNPSFPPDYDCVSLFSGGLDSLIGAIDFLADERRPLFVRHYADASTSTQRECIEGLSEVYGNLDTQHVRTRVVFRSTDFSTVIGSEETTRGRSFLFFALAALAASGMPSSTTIYVPENGLISLNVPLTPLRVGAWSTRTTHPFYMARWNDLLRQLGIQAVLENPYRFKTKGEMLSDCNNGEILKKLIGTTRSCSSISKARWQGSGPRHCGYCVPCLIRRASIKVSIGDDPTPCYSIPDLTEKPINSTEATGEHIRDFQIMAARLARRPQLAHLLIHKPGPLSDYDDDEIFKYIDVFQRGIEEVDSLVNSVRVKPL